MKIPTRTTGSTILALLALAPLGQAALVNLQAVADAEIGERPGEDRGSSGPSLNTRFVNDDRNEIMAFRFDLSGVDFNNVNSATLNLVHFRDNNSQRPYMVYGVADGATGGDNNGETPGYDDNTWDEGSVVMSTMPGVIYDGDATSQGINGTDTSNIGAGSFSDALEGQVEALTAPGLLGFLSSSPDSFVTLLVARDTSNLSSGQDRFASKEADALTNLTGSAGDWSPFLEVNVVPEPSSALLIALGGFAFGARRRRG